MLIVPERGRTFTGTGYPYPKATRNCKVNVPKVLVQLLYRGECESSDEKRCCSNVESGVGANIQT